MDPVWWFIILVIVLYLVYEFMLLYKQYVYHCKCAEQYGIPHCCQFLPHYSLLWIIVPKFIKKHYHTREFPHSQELVDIIVKRDVPLFAIVNYQGMNVFLGDPKLIKEATVNSKGAIPKASHLYGVLKLFGDNIVTAHDGDEWKKHRLAANPAFNEGNCELVCKSTVKQIMNMTLKWVNQGKPINVNEDCTKLTLAVISEAGFGQEFDMFGEKTNSNNNIEKKYRDAGMTMSFQEVMTIVSHHTLAKLITPKIVFKFVKTKFLQKVESGFDNFEKYAKFFITERRKDMEENKKELKDLLSLLLKADNLTSSDIVANTFMFLIAGHETTANTVSFALGLLAKHPEIQEKVREEARKLFGSSKNIEYSSVGDLKYAKAVFRETLRLYPSVVNIPKWTVADVELGGYRIPAQTQVSLSAFVTHRHPKVWDNPLEFYPERFLDWESGYDFIPFSVGQRSCIGKKFAMIEGVLVLSLICRDYKLIPNQCNLDDYETILTLTPKNPILLDIEPLE